MSFRVGDPVMLDIDTSAEELALDMGIPVSQAKTLLSPRSYIGTVLRVTNANEPTYIVGWDHLANDGDTYQFKEHELRYGG